MHRLAAEPRSTEGLLFSSWCPSGTILRTPYSMLWTGWFQERGQCFFYWSKLLYPYYSLLLFFPFSSFPFWGLRIDLVYITLSQPCAADPFLIIIMEKCFSSLNCWRDREVTSRRRLVYHVTMKQISEETSGLPVCTGNISNAPHDSPIRELSKTDWQRSFARMRLVIRDKQEAGFIG